MKFKIRDVICHKDGNEYYKIRGIYGDCYDAMICDKNGNTSEYVVSVDIWKDDENDFVKVH